MTRYVSCLKQATLLLAAWLLIALPPAASAQQLGTPTGSILTISSDRLFVESAFGQRIAREIEAESAVLAAENRKIESELTAEEQALTERRPTMEADAFRVLADAFDEKVQQIRREQEAKAVALATRRDKAQVEFFRIAAPVLEALMRETGAGVILERSSVFLSANATDVTDLAISRIDAVMGDGSDAEAIEDEE
jgi:Skp family chaperone for outer membrane proteins